MPKLEAKGMQELVSVGRANSRILGRGGMGIGRNCATRGRVTPIHAREDELYGGTKNEKWEDENIANWLCARL